MPGTAEPTSSTTPPYKIVPRKRSLERVPDLPQKRAAADQSRLYRKDGDVVPQRDTIMSMTMAGHTLRQQLYPLGPSNVPITRVSDGQSAPRILHHQAANAMPSQQVFSSKHVAPSQSQMKHPAHSSQRLRNRLLPGRVPSGNFHQPQQYFGRNMPPYSRNAVFSPSGHPMQMQQPGQPPHPSSPPHKEFPQNVTPAQVAQQQYPRHNQNVPYTSFSPPHPQQALPGDDAIRHPHLPLSTQQFRYAQRKQPYVRPNGICQDSIHLFPSQHLAAQWHATVGHPGQPPRQSQNESISPVTPERKALVDQARAELISMHEAQATQISTSLQRGAPQSTLLCANPHSTLRATPSQALDTHPALKPSPQKQLVRQELVPSIHCQPSPPTTPPSEVADTNPSTCSQQQHEIPQQHPLHLVSSKLSPPVTPSSEPSKIRPGVSWVPNDPQPPPQVSIAKIKTPEWSKTDLTTKLRDVATKYLTTVTPQLQPSEFSVVPGIPKAHSHASVAHFARFAPDHIWLLRHLDPVIRFQEYIEFMRLGRKMRDSDQSKDEYWDAFFMLQARSKALHKAEKERLSEFAEQSCETEDQAQDRATKWTGFVNRCASKYELHKINGHWNVQQVRSGKRGLEDGESIQPPSAKKSRKCSVDKTNVVEHDALSATPLETKIRDQIKAHKNGDGLDRRAQYNLIDLELGVGAGSRYGWESNGQEALFNGEQNESKARGFVKNETWYSDEENLQLDYWKRKYKGDEIRLPDHPCLDLKDYARRENGRFPCNHTASECVAGTCIVIHKDGKILHQCCKHGYDDAGKQASIRKAVSIYKGRVEAGIDKGLLSPRHKVWEKTVNERIKRKEKDARKLAQAKKQVSEDANQEASKTSTRQAQAPSVQDASTVPARSHLDAPLSAAQKAEAQEAEQKSQQEDSTRKWQFQRYEEEQKQLREKQRATQLPAFQRKKSAAFKKFRGMPNNIGQEYFEAWWDAFVAQELGDSLTDEQKKWRDRPVPEYATRKDIPPSMRLHVPKAPEVEPDEYDDLFNGSDSDEGVGL